ncbi:MAG: YdcF family protein [Clostridiaceae bacterium]|nr:YdcF family protein [Clostridiaceae bacterium]
MTKQNLSKKLLAGILLIVGTFLIQNTIQVYRYFTDWNLGVVLPAVFGTFCWLYALKLLFIEKPIFRNKRLRIIITSIIIASLLFFAAIELMIVIDPIVHSSVHAGKVDNVIVLGCGIWPDGRPTASLISRLDKAVSYFEDNPHVNIIVSGGQGPNEPFPEALAMEEYLIKSGVPKDKIIKEEKSTSTKENFEFSRRLINAPDEEKIKIVFVTNEFHVFRSRILAARFGFDAYAIAAPTPKVVMLNSYLREFFAFVKSMLVDY